MFHNIRWRIAIPYILLIALMMASLTLYLSRFLREVYVADVRAQLLSEARLASDALVRSLSQGATTDALDTLARRWARLVEARITIIAPDGVVLGDSHEDRMRMDNHLWRPEVQQALADGQGNSVRFSDTLGYEMMYTAVPAIVDGKVMAIVRVARPLRQVEIHTARLRQSILLTALATSVLAALFAVLIAERTVRPIRRLTREAMRMAEGDVGAPVIPTTSDEIGQLSHTFNRMAVKLQERVQSVSQERRLLATVLSRMADGVIITDGAEKVRLINPAAARLLDTTEPEAVGRPFTQVVRHHRLIQLWQRSRERREEVEEAIEVYRQDTFLRVIVTPLDDEGMEGTLTIFQDLTRIRRLETVRRDFISNVSHELRTPLASLKALVETLRDGALEDTETALRFLNRMETEVEALTQMVNELLELSRIESRQVPLQLAPATVAEVILPAVERLRPQAERAGLDLMVTLLPDLPRVQADIERAQQVVTNLVHNAIKFTPPGGQVTVSAEVIGEEMVIAVRDTGMGIAAEDLSRIFERFYKADRARSGGGTGLGLAIAKHIVQAHGGRIWAESEGEGHGSTFYFTLPLWKEQG
ncbi:MAG: HAMP domain-containing protein [Chloroflexi bacterium]|nr:HAMP domain-containing protein [Chloroflexota bacterium]